MERLTTTVGESGDLFGKMPIARRIAVVDGRSPPELTAARALCRQLRRKRTPRDKQRIAHLICLNLLTILKQSS
jgi:hypothetical protein